MLKPSEDNHNKFEASEGDRRVQAVCLIKAVPGLEKVVFHAIKEVGGVKRLYHIFGDHDLFMILESEGLSSLRRNLNDIEGMPSVNALKALLVEPGGRYSIDL